nr:unnamed protein product [Callosobruchus chinensis]
MSTSKSTSGQFPKQTSDQGENKKSAQNYFTLENSHQSHELRSDANRKSKCIKCRKVIDVPVGVKVLRNTTEKSASKVTKPSITEGPCHKCKKKASTHRCPKKTPKIAFEEQASSRSIKQHGSNAVVKCTTALKKELSSKDRPDDYILLEGPVYIRKNCLDVNGGTCRGTCCNYGKEIELDPEPVTRELNEEQRFQECRKCCAQIKCGEKKICDEDLEDIVATYEKLYLSNQSESKYRVEEDDSDPSGKPATGLSKTHGETPGDCKYHFLMTDVACSAPSDSQDKNDVVLTAYDHPQSPLPRPSHQLSLSLLLTNSRFLTTNTTFQVVQLQSLTIPSDEEESESSIFLAKLEPDEEEAEEEKAQEQEPAHAEVVSEEKTKTSVNGSEDKNDEGDRRDSKVSWGGESPHSTTLDTSYSEDENDDKTSRVRISEAPKRDSGNWRQQSMDRMRNSKKNASFVKKSLVGAAPGLNQSSPTPPPPKKRFCSFFRRKNKLEKVKQTGKSRSQTFNKDPDSSESSEISFEESRRTSSRS